MSESRLEGIRQFEQARWQARVQAITSRLTGKDTRIIPFDAIRTALRQQNPMYRGIQQIPVDQIVGSVGRYHEFNREFLPLNDSLRERWVNVTSLAITSGWPPIDVYKVGEAYFVKDGNHRVSVSRQLHIPTIEAHIWEFPEDLPIDPNGKIEDMLMLFGERNFMEKTHLDRYVPDHQIRFTSVGRYWELLAQIEDLHKTLSLIDGEEMPYEEAVQAWYEIVYLPTIEIIRESTLLKDFPGRTESDLFVWLSMHREGLQAAWGEYQNLADLAQILADKYKEGSISKMARQVRRLLGSDELPPLAELDVLTSEKLHEEAQPTKELGFAEDTAETEEVALKPEI